MWLWRGWAPWVPGHTHCLFPSLASAADSKDSLFLECIFSQQLHSSTEI